MTPWQLPQSLQVGNRQIPIRCDYRDILKIFSVLDDPDLPVFLRWETALRIFYREKLDENEKQAALQQLIRFINCGDSPPNSGGEQLLDWQQDGNLIAAEVNRVAGQEIRVLPFLHWWTFLGYFHAVGEGQLSTVVGIRQKLRRGRPLEKWEQEFYRENRQTVDLKKRYSSQELAEKQALEQLIR